MKTQIALLDCNNFFVSCERLFRPDLHNVPVLVLSSNDGCVVARSQEVKDIGIPMGVPYFKIKDIVEKEHIRVFSGHITLYRDISSRVFTVLRELVATTEQYSIDESFFEIPHDVVPEIFIAELKQEIERLVGMPVSIGVGFSKTQAKYASSIAKKSGGLFVLTEKEWNAKQGAISLESIWGVGAGLAKRLRSHGLETVADFIQVDLAFIGTTLGVVGRRLHSELQGIPAYPVTAKRALQKSLMNSRSFAQSTMEQSVIFDAAAYHVRHIAAELRSMGAACTTMRVFLNTSRHGDFFLRGGSKEIVFTVPTSDTLVMIKQVELALKGLFEYNTPYTKVGVVAGGIVMQSHTPATLFDFDRPEQKDNKDLLLAMDTINQKVGKELITIGSRLRTSDWQAKAEQRSPAYTTRWSEIATVSAR